MADPDVVNDGGIQCGGIKGFFNAVACQQAQYQQAQNDKLQDSLGEPHNEGKFYDAKTQTAYPAFPGGTGPG